MRAVRWYHHHLQHPGHTRLKETMNTAMYWKGMRTTIRSITKSCKSCQVNRRRSQKYGNLPPKTVYTIPWEYLCVDLIGAYTLKGKENLQIDFMALTMINPAGILHKAESVYGKEPWTITTVHTNGTIRIQCGTKTEQLSIRRVERFTDDIL